MREGCLPCGVLWGPSASATSLGPDAHHTLIVCVTVGLTIKRHCKALGINSRKKGAADCWPQIGCRGVGGG